jgi:hypothetical protein
MTTTERRAARAAEIMARRGELINVDEHTCAYDWCEGTIRGWLPETVDRWNASRPGRGARTDLESIGRPQT